MVFSELSFLYALLPLTALCYFPIRSRRWRNGVLLCASLLFYAWGEPRFLPGILLATLVAWVGGLGIARAERADRPRARKVCFLITTVLLLGNLVVFKYLGFLCENLARLGLPVGVPAITLPIGISFYTFQILSYVIDLYRGTVKVQRSLFRLGLYVSFFPQLIAGPIVRYETVEREIAERQESWDDVVAGTKRFVLGLGKKVLLANGVARFAEAVYGGSPEVCGTAAFWLASLAYALQLYFDFSGYSDMAIGLGRIFGFHFLENFDYPYISRSITEFWRRWHISLSSWFRDYVYIPLGGSRCPKAKWVRNILIVWALTGLWHGAQWNFVLWGLYYALLLLAEKFTVRLREKLPAALRWLVTFVLVDLGWVLFNRTDMASLGLAFRRMFVWAPTDWVSLLSGNTAAVPGLLWLLPALVLAFPVLRRFRERELRLPGALAADAGYVLVFLLSLITIVSSGYDPFIYFRF